MSEPIETEKGLLKKREKGKSVQIACASLN